MVIKSAESWLLNSGIQRFDPTHGTPGGMYAWFDKKSKSHSFLYSEITGYAITSFIDLYRRTGQQVFMDRAILAGDWLVNEAIEPSGAVRCRQYHSGWQGNLYTFDAGMCLNGLVNLYKWSTDPRYLSASLNIAEWLIHSMANKVGGFFSQFDEQSNTAFNTSEKWSTISGSFLVKLAIGLLNLYEVARDNQYPDTASRLCEWGLKLQHEDGRFNTSPLSGETFIHPHCYTAEGLLIAGKVLGDRRLLESAANAVSWVVPSQLSDGAFPAHYADDKFDSTSSPDITSQVIRLWLLLPDDLRINCPVNLEAALGSIAATQCWDGSSQTDGGFPAGPAWFYGQREDHSGEHVNSWVTMFSLQALVLALSNRKDFDPFLLV